MNVTERILSDENYKNAYFEKLRQMESQKNMFIDFTKRMREAEAKRQKAEGKKRRRNGVIVSGATSKDDIRKLKRILQQKAAEILTEEGDYKLKNLQVGDLYRKIASLDRILADIERIEREQLQNKQKRNKKGSTESVYLSGDNLSVNKNGSVDIAAALPGSSVQTQGVDIVAGFEAMIAAVDAPTVDAVV